MPPRRSTPKILHQAGELRKQTTPAEKKLWAYLRLMREDGVRFRRQHAIGTYITDFPWHRPPGRCVRHVGNSLLNWMGANIWNKRNMIKREPIFSNLKVIKLFAFDDVMNNIEGVILSIMNELQGGLRSQ
jgi:very-short-patch-repair endonuclease